MDALQNIPRYNRETVKHLMGFLVKFTTYISETCLAKIELEKEILERKQAEEALRDSEAHLRTVIDTIPDLIWLKDPSGVYLSCNPKFERFFGAKESDIVGKTDYNFVRKELADSFRQNDATAMSAGIPSINEEEITYAADGHRELIETIKTPMYDSKGRLIGVLGISRDITASKLAEELMSKSNTLLTSVINQAPFAIQILEGEFSDISVVIENAESGRIMGEVVGGRTGIDADIPEMLTTRFLSIDGKREIPLSQMPSPRAFQGEVVTNEEFIFRHADGTQIMVEASASPIYDASNQIIAIAVVFQDITKRKNAEKEREQLRNQLIQSQKMEAIGTLAGGIAHDFNNILFPIVGYAEMTLEDVPEKSLIHQNIGMILKSALRAADLVKQILTFSRQHEQELIPLRADIVVKEALKLMRSTLPSTIEIYPNWGNWVNLRY